MKNIFFSIVIAVFSLSVFYSCDGTDTPNVSLGIDDHYRIPRMYSYRFTPGYTGAKYCWTMKLNDGRDSVLSTERSLIFVSKDEGIYDLTFEIIDPYSPYRHDFRIEVVHEEVEYSGYIAKVYEYKPAPGQFINKLPAYEKGDTEESMRQKVEKNIKEKNNVMISLGGYGGYVTFAFDHTVMNVDGKMDFGILGNAFYSDVEYGKGGSCEPGIVMVAFDKNKNGKPDDDEWYELAGSEYYKPETTKNYEITYYRPDENKVPTPDPTNQLTDTTYLKWVDNLGVNSYMPKNMSHNQSYFPQWLSENELTFKGTRLKNNARDESGTGRYWVLYAYDWGYADNHPNDSIYLNSFDINWAVDREGNPVKLPGADFIRVYTAVNQYCGWIGETSTEISKAWDWHVVDPKEIIPDTSIEDYN